MHHFVSVLWGKADKGDYWFSHLNKHFCNQFTLLFSFFLIETKKLWWLLVLYWPGLDLYVSVITLVHQHFWSQNFSLVRVFREKLNFKILFLWKKYEKKIPLLIHTQLQALADDKEKKWGKCTENFSFFFYSYIFWSLLSFTHFYTRVVK